MLEVRSLYKTYEGKPLLTGISFTVAQGETVCLLGASGSGKSTLLRMIAGLESPDSGFISFNGLDLAAIPPHLRDFGLVFQEYALFPHLSVSDNVAFGLKMRRMDQSKIAERVAGMLELVNLKGFENRNVTDLSGGEGQRVALARALAIRPRLLMFDEPLGALDRTLREGLLDELRSILRKTQVPAIYVTHDQEEAFAIADRVLILHEGKIIREGTPAGVWANPQAVYVAEFLGLGNVLEGKVRGKKKDGKWGVGSEFGNFIVRCSHKHSKGENVRLLARPFEVRNEANVLRGVVSDVVFQKDRYKVTLDNGLYLYVKDAPKVGRKISVRVKIECLG
ncbi:MAG: ABC transporter ATP-binding protein [Chloroflexota bacterium]